MTAVIEVAVRCIHACSECGVQSVLVQVKRMVLLLPLARSPNCCRCLVSSALPVAVLLICANDELAEELVAETVKVVTVELSRLLTLEVGFCEFC
jgi:hypothetical protein